MRGPSVRSALIYLEAAMKQKHTPFTSRREFIHTIVCIVAAYPEIMKRKGLQSLELGHRLLNILESGRIEFYLNRSRYRGTLSVEDDIQLDSGTTMNEAFHGELKQVFRQVQCIQESQLRKRLHVLVMCKQVARQVHNSSTKTPHKFVRSHVKSSIQWATFSEHPFTEDVNRRLSVRTGDSSASVSYTHLTLPTILLV